MLKLGRRARGHFVTRIKIRVHLIRVKPGHISLLCQVLPATFTVSLVKKCQGDDVYQVPQPSTFHKTLAN